MLNFYREGLSFEVGKPSRGIGALTPDAAQQLGPKAVELQKKEAAAVKLPQVKLANSYNRNIKKEKKLNEFSLPGTGTVMAPSGGVPYVQKKVLGVTVPFSQNVVSPSTGGIKKPNQYNPNNTEYSSAQVQRYNANKNAPSVLKPTEYGPTSISKTPEKPRPTFFKKPTTTTTATATPAPTATPTPKPTTASGAMQQALKDVPLLGDVADIAKKYDDKSNYRNLRNQMGLQNSYEMDYQNVLETLVNHNFANDYDSAVDMITGLSEKFIQAISEEYLEEKARGTRPKTTSHAYDMDETLFGHDDSKVNVHVHNEKGERTHSLSNQEFNTFKLPKGHNYNFDEFRSSKVFGKSAKPLKKMIKHLNRQKARGYDTHIVTARSDMDDQPAFAKHLSKYGININPNEEGSGHTHVHRTGNLPGSDVGVKKRDTLQGLAQKHGYKKIHMYDDAAKVHKAVQNTPGVEVKTHMVKPRGKSGEVRARSFRATETQKEQYYIDFGTNVEELREVDTTPYEYWKEFIR